MRILTPLGWVDVDDGLWAVAEAEGVARLHQAMVDAEVEAAETARYDRTHCPVCGAHWEDGCVC